MKKVFLIFTNILIDLNGHKYINNDLLEEIQKLIEIGIQKDKIIEKLRHHAVKTEEGKKHVSESQKELQKKISDVRFSFLAFLLCFCLSINSFPFEKKRNMLHVFLYQYFIIGTNLFVFYYQYNY